MCKNVHIYFALTLSLSFIALIWFCFIYLHTIQNCTRKQWKLPFIGHNCSLKTWRDCQVNVNASKTSETVCSSDFQTVGVSWECAVIKNKILLLLSRLDLLGMLAHADKCFRFGNTFFPSIPLLTVSVNKVRVTHRGYETNAVLATADLPLLNCFNLATRKKYTKY